MDPTLDVDSLLNALENETHGPIMNLTTQKIKEYKNNILQQLQLPRGQLKKFHKKLKEYRYCNDLSHIQYGYYIRWISLKDPLALYLTNGGIICDVKILNKQIQILCKNNRNQMMQIKFDEAIIFQKLSDQEKVILGILDYLEE